MTEAEQLWSLYSQLGSVHRVGEVIGVCGQTVKARLNAAGYRLNNAAWSQEEIELLKKYYAETPDDEFSITLFAASIKRTFASVALKASRIGVAGKRTDKAVFSKMQREAMSLAQKARAEKLGGDIMAAPLLKWCSQFGSAFEGKSHTQALKDELSKRAKEWYRNNPHPRGMLGKTHNDETRQLLSKLHTGRKCSREQIERALRTKAKRGNLHPPRNGCTWKSSWVEIGGKRFFARSRWEANYARFLEWQKSKTLIAEWEHEPETFWFSGVKRGCVSYLPDFRITLPDGSIEYHEVKGWMDSRSKTKIRRMAKYHPNVVLKIIDSATYRRLARSLIKLIPDWESSPRRQSRSNSRRRK